MKRGQTYTPLFSYMALYVYNQLKPKVMSNELKAIIEVKKIRGTSFIGVRGYTNKDGEVSNQTFVVGINYPKMLADDLETLKSFDVKKLVDKFSIESLEAAKKELIESLEKRLSSDEVKAELLANNDATMNRSVAQTEAFTHLTNGLKVKENDVYVYGIRVRKTVLVAIEYKAVKSAEKTLAKKAINKFLRSDKFINFKLGNMDELKINGITL